MNSKTIHSEMMKMIHQVLIMSLTRKMEPGCESNDCSIRVVYLDICLMQQKIHVNYK